MQTVISFLSAHYYAVVYDLLNHLTDPDRTYSVNARTALSCGRLSIFPISVRQKRTPFYEDSDGHSNVTLMKTGWFSNFSYCVIMLESPSKA